MTDLTAIQDSLTTPEAFLELCTESGVFGAKKQAARAHELWQSASSRQVLAYRAIPLPGGTGTGLLVGLYWDPAVTTPDFDAIAYAVIAELPRDLIRADEKAAWKTRDKKQNVFFGWRGMRGRPLSAWFQERFGVEGVVHQVMAASDFEDNIAVAIVADGEDRVWPTAV
ncbi:hypothetical protein ACFVU2_06565 [Leifsonia sp. NPDC058194]|uniref:hypothetical protein n=1 Tax=Leifsonia sp. NPDC058194 TaxID=3346374 RepID=UPI0036D8CE51